ELADSYERDATAQERHPMDDDV
ncbi:MAG: hypothetical protein RLZZ387_5333, partial [Chloroflexota bacterium]